MRRWVNISELWYQVMSEPKPFFTTLPGILSGLAALITAVGGLLFALHQTGVLGTTNTPPSRVEHASESPAAVTAAPFAEATEGWAIIGKARGGKFFDLDILVEGDSPAIGKRYKVVNDFRLVAKGPREDRGGAQVVTLGMVRRGDTVELLDLFVPVPSTKTVPVYAKLRAVLDRVGK